MLIVLILSVALPLFVSVTAWAALGVPTRTLGKVRLVGVRATMAPRALPLRLMLWGVPAASSTITMPPLRAPGAVGVNVTERVQLPAADTLFPQLSVSAKSPLVEIDEIESGALPMFRTTAVWGWLLVPII